jgi:hypothetical protein
VQIDIVDRRQAFNDFTGGPDTVGGDLEAHSHGNAQAFGKVFFGEAGFFPDKTVPFRFATNRPSMLLQTTPQGRMGELSFPA